MINIGYSLYYTFILCNSKLSRLDMENNNDRTECEFIIFWIVSGYLHTF